VALQRYSRIAAVSVTVLAFCAVIASWVVLERPYGTIGKIAASIAPFIALFVALGIALAAAAFRRKPLRSPNYPRVEHLRIAGKYHAVGRYGEMGSSPLHLRG
jgi:nitrate/nitrite transporter NarK